MQPEVTEAVELLERIEETGGTARALGGIGVAIRCPSVRVGSSLARSYGDLDLAITRKSIPGVSRVAEAAGYQPSRRFNAAHGRTRLLFVHENGRHLDVFIETFVMCHVLPLRDRLTIHERTLSLADLLLTKLQVAQLNRKDVLDVTALALDHPATDGEEGINVDYIAGVLSGDWGWWRTVSENVKKVLEIAPKLNLRPNHLERVESGFARLLKSAVERPKPVRWRMRARIGDRASWRDEPEELGH